LVESKDIEALNLELDNRLDDLFGETDILLPDVEPDNQKEEYPLAELKNSILSIDWEITDEVLDKLVQQIQDLLTKYEDDKIVKTFLQILNSLGNYIRIHRGKAPPKTFRILNSVFSSLDKVVLSKDMTESAKKKLLRTEMKSYKELRSLTAKSSKSAAKEKVKSEAATATDVGKKEPIIRLAETSKSHIEKEKKAAPETHQDEPALELEIEAKEEAPLLAGDEPEIELTLPEAEASKASDTRSQAEPEDRMEVKAEERMEVEAEERVEVEAGERMEVEPGERMEVEPGERMEVEAEERMEFEVEERMEVEAEERLEVEVEERMEFEVEERMEVEPESRLQAEPRIQSEPEDRPKAEPEDRAKTEPETRVKAEPEPAAAALAEAVDEIKRYIHIEIKALRKEIRILRKQI